MRIIATIEVDIDRTPLGTTSRCADMLQGRPILLRTIDRLKKSQHLGGVYLLCLERQLDRVSQLASGSGAVVKSHGFGDPPWRPLVQTARKWSRNGWRGGLGGSTIFDEYTDARVLSELLKSVEADAVLSVPPAAPFVDPGIVDRMIAHRRAVKDEARMVVTQAPPGVAGILLDGDLVHELGAQGIPIGWLISYKPDAPQKDVLFTSCHCDIPVELRHASGRLIADTDSSCATVEALFRDHPEPDAATIGRWLAQRDRSFVADWPEEVEIELNTDEPYPASMMRPHVPAAQSRGSMSLEVVEAIGHALAQRDDALVVLGGFGDPLRHPQFDLVLEKLRVGREQRASGFGLAVRTHGLDLSDERIESIIRNKVDVVEVQLDAWTEGVYSLLHSPGDRAVRFERVLARINRLTERRESAGLATPILLPSFTKCKENVHELDEFHDGWLRRVGAVAIHGFSHYSGRLEDRSVMRMTPPRRIPCRRLWKRCVVLADGRVTLCDQDAFGTHIVGRLPGTPLGDIWKSASLHDARERHTSLGQCGLPILCRSCDEWHRP